MKNEIVCFGTQACACLYTGSVATIILKFNNENKNRAGLSCSIFCIKRT